MQPQLHTLEPIFPFWGEIYFFNSFPSTPLPPKSLQPQRDVSFLVPQSPGAALHLALP